VLPSRSVSPALKGLLRDPPPPPPSTPPLQRALYQQGKGRHKDVPLHPRLHLMVDRPHGQHILQVTETPLPIHELLVPGHGIEQTAVLLARGDDVASLQAFLLRPP